MLAAETELKNAEKVKMFLQKKDLLDENHLVIKELGRIFFPITKKVKVPNAKVIDANFSFPKKDKVPKIEELLKGNQINPSFPRDCGKDHDFRGS